VHKVHNLPPSCVITKSGNFNFLEPSGPLRACNGTAFFLYCTKVKDEKWHISVPLYVECSGQGQLYRFTVFADRVCRFRVVFFFFNKSLNLHHAAASWVVVAWALSVLRSCCSWGGSKGTLCITFRIPRLQLQITYTNYVSHYISVSHLPTHLSTSEDGCLSEI